MPLAMQYPSGILNGARFEGCDARALAAIAQRARRGEGGPGHRDAQSGISHQSQGSVGWAQESVDGSSPAEKLARAKIRSSFRRHGQMHAPGSSLIFMTWNPKGGQPPRSSSVSGLFFVCFGSAGEKPVRPFRRSSSGLGTCGSPLFSSQWRDVRGFGGLRAQPARGEFEFWVGSPQIEVGFP